MGCVRKSAGPKVAFAPGLESHAAQKLCRYEWACPGGSTVSALLELLEPRVVQKPSSHRGKLGGGQIKSCRSPNDSFDMSGERTLGTISTCDVLRALTALKTCSTNLAGNDRNSIPAISAAAVPRNPFPGGNWCGTTHPIAKPRDKPATTTPIRGRENRCDTGPHSGESDSVVRLGQTSVSSQDTLGVIDHYRVRGRACCPWLR